MITVELTKGHVTDKLSGMFADCLTSPAQTVSKVANLKQTFDKVKNGALAMTAARLRKRLVEVFESNTNKWREPENAKYSNWFGIGGQEVGISGLIKSNKPLKTVTSKGTAKARGYSRKSYIRPPKKTQVGGKFKNMMRYQLDKAASNFKVGLLDDFAGSTWAKRFQTFQEGGSMVFWYGDPIRTQKYFGALGMYLRKYPIFKIPRRPVVEPIQRRYPPEQLFKEAFEQKLREV